jgi:hypothetical protein
MTDIRTQAREAFRNAAKIGEMLESERRIADAVAIAVLQAVERECDQRMGYPGVPSLIFATEVAKLLSLVIDPQPSRQDEQEFFPIMGEKVCTRSIVTLPWALIAPHEAQAKVNHSQTLKRLAERGGLAPCEAVAVLEDRPWVPMRPFAFAENRLRTIINERCRVIPVACPSVPTPREGDA